VGFPSRTIPELLPYIDGKMYRKTHIDWLPDNLARRAYTFSWTLRRVIEKVFGVRASMKFVARNPLHNHPTNSVYAYVPVEVVEQIVDNHGGLA
jgi:hypothetical protein